MTLRKKKTDRDESPRLSPWDILALTQAEHAAKLAAQEIRTLEIEKQNLEAQHQVLMLRVKLTQDGCDKKLQEARTRLAQSKADASKLSAQLATRHHFSWDTHSYNPETGDLVVLES